MSRQRQIRITSAGVGYFLIAAAMLGGGVGRQLNLLMLVGSLLAGLFVFSLFYGRWALARLKVERGLPHHLCAQDRLVVTLTVSNDRRLGVWGLRVEDTVLREGDPPADGTRVAAFCSYLPRRATRQLRYEGQLPLRGPYHFGPLRISTRFPLGLVRHSRVIPASDMLLVHPKLGQLSHDWAQMVYENPSGSERVHRRGLLEADFYGLRDWRSGDSRRWIHWRASARRGNVVVRQFEQRRSQDLALLVDLWQPPHPSEAELDHVERVISFVATVIAEAGRQAGRHLAIHCAAQQPLERVGPVSALYLRDQMEALAVVQPHHAASLPPLLGHALAKISPSMPTLVVSTRPIDSDLLARHAAERGAQLEGRPLQLLCVTGDAFARYYHE